MTSSGSDITETRTCQACGALVDASLAQRHQDFHDDLLSKKALEEQARQDAVNLRSSM